MKFIVGKKIEMTQVWQGDTVLAVTKVKAAPCTVVQIKSGEKDGYTAIQLGCGERKDKNINKPQLGHTKGLGKFEKLREFRLEKTDEIKVGDKIDVSTFEAGDQIQVTSTSKGKGFQGGMKRHGFRGHKMTHGNKDQQRMSGSVGAKGPARVFKGTRMPGRMGGERVTIKNLKIIEVDLENNILTVSGAIPGARNGLVLISGNGDLKIAKPNTEQPIVNDNQEPTVENKPEVDNSTEKATPETTQATEAKEIDNKTVEEAK